MEGTGAMPQPGPAHPYRVVTLNGGEDVPAHDIVGAVSEAGTGPTFGVTTFHYLDDLLDHLEAQKKRGLAADVVVVGPGSPERLAAARSVRERDARVQILFLVPSDEVLRVRRAVLYNPLLGDAWTADVDADKERLRTLLRDAAERTRRRRGVDGTLEAINRRLSEPPVRRAPREARRTASEHYLASLLEHAPDPIVSADVDGRIVSWNDAAAGAFGHTLDEALGLPLESLFTPSVRPSVRGLLDTVTAGERMHRPEVDCLRADGSVFQGEVTLAPVRDDAGTPVGASLVVRDVSERVREQRDLEEATERLKVLVEELQVRTREAEAASTAKSEFLAALSHELRTPLQAIIGYTVLLVDRMAGPLSESQDLHLDRIRHNADHLLHLIEQLLDLSRSETAALEVEPRPFDLCALVTESVEATRPDAEAKGLALPPSECSRPELRRLQGDPVRVRQVLMNLLSNAVKFTDEGQVSVELDVSDSAEARVRVHDTGPGLDEADLDRIFEPFVQVRTPSGDRAAGLGLGLPISRRLAESMGGRLEVRSEVDHGTEFAFYLPIVDPGVADDGGGDPVSG